MYCIENGMYVSFDTIRLLQVNADYVFTQLFNGLILGMTLALISIGLTIIFGMLKIINFAHGDLMLVGAYLAWMVSTEAGSLLAGILIAAIGVGILGLIIERFTLRYVYGYDPLLQLLLTFGLAILIRGIVQLTWGKRGKNFSIPQWGEGMVDFVLFQYPVYRLFVIISTVVIVFLIYFIITRTDLGLVIRAGTEDREMVSALGFDINKTFTIVFGFGAAIAGIAGALIGPARGVYPTLGVELLIPSFVVVVIGGLGNILGSVIAGILVGELMVLTGTVYSPASDIIIFVVMAIVIVVRPGGLFGTVESDTR